ncbi:hypothetical protein ACFQV2_22300 [Actinokineospora soli]|uniref:Uncharacterized protein n=1 Tax=Actinokineospora soli TaxID=1048753 RepID=A0ABW2TSD1_9PSEU
MSSNPRGSSLRTKLIAEQTVLLAMVCLVIGLTVMVALQAFLTDRLDTDLREAAGRTRMLVEPPRRAACTSRSPRPRSPPTRSTRWSSTARSPPSSTRSTGPSAG